MTRLTLIVALTASLGCIEQHSAAADPRVGDAAANDATALDATALDAAPVRDANIARDMRTPDAGLPSADLGVIDAPPLARALSCDMRAEDALRATVRWVACTPDDDRSTVTGLMEAWAAGLFGTGDPFARQLSSQQTGQGCDRWRCVASATSCEAASACQPGPRRPDVVCEAGDYCENNAVTACDDDLSRQVLNCTTLGMMCQHAPGSGRTFCASDACQTVLGVNELVCDGNRLTACEGTIAVDCDTWRPGSRCQSFAIGGEVPINFCGPVGFGGAGAYATPVECGEDGVITFTALQVDAYRFDCRAAGYSGCDARGCVE